MNLKIVKTVSGETLLGEVSEDKNGITIKDCTNLILTNQGGQPAIVLANINSFMSDDKDVVINKSQLLYYLNPNDDVQAEYAKQMGRVAPVQSKLVLPK